MQCVEYRRKTQLLGQRIVMKGILPRTAFLGRYNAESLISQINIASIKKRISLSLFQKLF